jgi:hypothetical protein
LGLECCCNRTNTFISVFFCDSIPQNILDKYFTSSSRSFSDGYNSFLSLINLQAFPIPSILTQNIADNTPPQSSGSTKNGWTQVLNQSGLLEYKRVWNVTQSPQTWLSSILQSQKNEHVELIFDDPGLSIHTEKGTICCPATAGAQMKILANAVGRIQVNPDSWYNSSVITIAQSNKKYFIVDPDVVFGKMGLINCRISEFIVALKPSPSVTIDNSFIEQQNISQGSITGVSLGGFAFTNQESFSINTARVVEKVNFSLSSSDEKRTQITGNITGADLDNIFIIAVIVEAYTMSG